MAGRRLQRVGLGPAIDGDGGQSVLGSRRIKDQYLPGLDPKGLRNRVEARWRRGPARLSFWKGR